MTEDTKANPLLCETEMLHITSKGTESSSGLRNHIDTVLAEKLPEPDKTEQADD